MLISRSILFLGFSVTADKDGYAYRLAKILHDDYHCNVQICGIGGIQPQHLIYIIEYIFEMYYFDVVFLEIDTSGWRTANLSNESRYMALRYIFEISHRNSKEIFVLNLPRLDVDYNLDYSGEIIRSLSLEFNINLIDLAKIYFNENIIHDLLKDDVHPNEMGVNKYVLDILDFLHHADKQECIFKGKYYFDPGTFFLYNRFDGEFNIDTFERSGFKAKCLVLNAGCSLILNLDKECFVDGILSVWGPKSGKITIHGENDFYEYYAYDEYCYYNRYGVKKFKSIKSGIEGKIVLRLHSDIPSVKLLKGTPNNEAREVLFAGLLCSSQNKWKKASDAIKLDQK